MKPFVAALAGLLALAIAAAPAEASPEPLTLEVGDERYLGYVTPGAPAGRRHEEAYVNALITMAPGTEALCGDRKHHKNTCVRGVPSVSGETETNFHTRIGPHHDLFDEHGNVNPVDVTGFEYLLAMYCAGGDFEESMSYVWYVEGLDRLVTVPAEMGGRLTHISLFRRGAAVPDAGATLALLGGALAVLGLVRRRLG
jgi:hypothetical protein